MYLSSAFWFMCLLIGSSLGQQNSSDPIVIDNTTIPIPITEVNPSTPPPDPPTPSSNTTTPPTSTTTTAPINTTTVAPTTSTSTARTTSTTVTPINTTTTTTTTTTSTTVTSPTTTKVPATTTTAAPPHERKFDGPSFVGGIILALGMVAIGFVAFKFYKARTEMNYHTL